MLGHAAHMGTSQVSNLLDSVSCSCTLQPLYPHWHGSQDSASWWTWKSRAGAKKGKVGDNEKARASPPPNTTLYMEPESLKTPRARPPSCQGPAALGPQLVLAHAEPRPGAVPGHSRCPVGSRMWAGGEQAAGRPHHAHPSSCAKSRARPGPSNPARPRLLGHLHGADLPASQAGDSKVRFPCYPPRPVLPQASDLLGPPDPQGRGACRPFAILKTFEGN